MGPLKPESSSISFEPALDLTIGELADLFNQAFEGYLIPVSVNGSWLADRIRVDGVDLGASRVMLHRGERVGLALVARRGSAARVAAMGVKATARGKKVGRATMDALISESRSRNERRLVLEVIEQNTPAVQLYLGCGFKTIQRLLGFTAKNLTPPADCPADELSEVDVADVAQLLSANAPADFPWQLSGESLALLGPPHRGFQCGEAHVVLSNPLEEVVWIRSLYVPQELRRQGRATHLIHCLFHAFPDRVWKVPIVFPSRVAKALFEPLGFERESLSQLMMGLELP